MRLAIAGMACVLAGPAAWSADRWESRGDDGAFTSNVLQPGVVQEGHDLEPKVKGPDVDWYKVMTQEERSYEVRVFGGGVIWKYPACPTCASFERVAGSDGSVLQQGDADQVGDFTGLSLRWIGSGNGLQFVRASPYSDAPGHVAEKYDVLLHDTTLYLPRFNNTGSQRTVLILQSTRERTVEGKIFFHDSAGVRLLTHDFSVPPYGSLVLDTGTLPALVGQSGSGVVAHTGGQGAFTGKAVSLEPSTGFTFDTAITTAPR